MEKQRHHFVNKGLSSQGYGFSSGHVQMWELDCKESWATKNWCFWTVVVEKILESPLDCTEIQPVHPKGNQSWIFIGRTDVEAETPILWPPDAKTWLTGEDPDAGKDWRWEEKGTRREDEMVGWHHRLNGHESGQSMGVGDGQGSLACCSPWDCEESDTTERLNWTEDKHIHFFSPSFSNLPCKAENIGFSSHNVQGGKASACNVGGQGSIPGLGRSPGEGNGNPLQYSCLENPTDEGAWKATVHGVAKSLTWLSDFTHSIYAGIYFSFLNSFYGIPPADSRSCELFLTYICSPFRKLAGIFLMDTPTPIGITSSSWVLEHIFSSWPE